MSAELKGRSPFYPGQPVPAEFFAGRLSEIHHITERGIGQVALGKPVSIFVQGEYGIGKSSFAGYVQSIAEKEFGLHGIYVSLAGCRNLTDLASSVLEATIRSGAFDPSRSEKIRSWLSKYIGKQELFAFSLNLENLKRDAPTLANAFGMLNFLEEVRIRLDDASIKGVFLILDEINGIASLPDFSHFIKGLVDTNAMSAKPLPLLLALCGVEERRREMIQSHQPVDRIFDVIDMGKMSDEEMVVFFRHSFSSVKIAVNDDAMETLTFFSAGFPKIMHMIGDAAFWIDKDNIIDSKDAIEAIFDAAEEVGRKYVDQQVYKALRSEDYHSILSKIAKLGPAKMNFSKTEIMKGLNENERRKFNNFIQKMKKLNVIRNGESRGDYVFNIRMVQIYIWLHSRKRGSQNA